MVEIFGFYFFALVSLAMFGVAVFSKSPIYAMSALAGGMIFISGFFFMLGAEFLGVVQILVYTGAVIVLYSFAMMFFDANKDVKEDFKNKKLISTLSLFSALLLFLMVLSPIVANSSRVSYDISGAVSNTHGLGVLIFTKYLLAFELVALLLLVAMICGIVLVHKEMDKKREKEER